MTKEEFEQIIEPIWLIDNKTHIEFLIQSITGNFNRWNESKVKNLSSNAALEITRDSKANDKESEVAVAFADWIKLSTSTYSVDSDGAICDNYRWLNDSGWKTTKELYEIFKIETAKATNL